MKEMKLGLVFLSIALAVATVATIGSSKTLIPVWLGHPGGFYLEIVTSGYGVKYKDIKGADNHSYSIHISPDRTSARISTVGNTRDVYKINFTLERMGEENVPIEIDAVADKGVEVAFKKLVEKTVTKQETKHYVVVYAKFENFTGIDYPNATVYVKSEAYLGSGDDAASKIYFCDFNVTYNSTGIGPTIVLNDSKNGSKVLVNTTSDLVGSIRYELKGDSDLTNKSYIYWSISNTSTSSDPFIVWINLSNKLYAKDSANNWWWVNTTLNITITINKSAVEQLANTGTSTSDLIHLRAVGNITLKNQTIIDSTGNVVLIDKGLASVGSIDVSGEKLYINGSLTNGGGIGYIALGYNTSFNKNHHKGNGSHIYLNVSRVPYTVTSTSKSVVEEPIFHLKPGVWIFTADNGTAMVIMYVYPQPIASGDKKVMVTFTRH
jgi:hypothetical protein